MQVNLLYAAYLAMTAVIERFPGEGCSELQPLARLLIARLTTLHGSLHQVTWLLKITASDKC